MTWTFRIAVVVLPFLVFVFTRKLCRDLAAESPLSKLADPSTGATPAFGALPSPSTVLALPVGSQPPRRRGGVKAAAAAAGAGAVAVAAYLTRRRRSR